MFCQEKKFYPIFLSKKKKNIILCIGGGRGGGRGGPIDFPKMPSPPLFNVKISKY